METEWVLNAGESHGDGGGVVDSRHVVASGMVGVGCGVHEAPSLAQ